MSMRFFFLLGAAGAALMAQLPEGPGMAETARTCKGCHEVERSVSLRQDKDGWNTMWDEAEKVLEGKIELLANNAGINPGVSLTT